MYRDVPSESNKNFQYRRLNYSDSEMDILLTLSHYANNSLVKFHKAFCLKDLLHLFSLGLIHISNVKEILPTLLRTDFGEYYFPTLEISKLGEVYYTDYNRDNCYIYDHLSKYLKIKLTQIGRGVILDVNKYGW